MRIGIDAMGGDGAPRAEVQGALDACASLNEDDKIVLVGDKDIILKHLSGNDGWEKHIEIRHASQVVGMNESPVEALRSKPDSSIAVLVRLHKEREIDACISAGNTGAFAAAGQMLLRRLKGVHRPGIAIVTPTPRGPVAVCDVGANVSCRPLHLYQYGLMASVYLSAMCDIPEPRVGLLSIGTEEAKGNDLVKKTRELFQNDSRIPFVGNVEGRDLFSGVCDVMICEGFVGNVMLKVLEGIVEGLMSAMIKELGIVLPDQISALKQVGLSTFAKYDFNEYGGAPLLGVNGLCIICHGASDNRGIMNAVTVVRELANRQMNERIVEVLSQGPEDS
ncbi:MAG: phosphate acyltransferase PlsX [Phycisphaerae bacterium]|jgi:glycerol-3-phosphate acyltransferase PlsX|nr:phosphate acyltransferase PlsX [Phycisphaerae bacterium]